MKPAIITTVIPTWRRPKLLKRAIRSALNQTRRDLIVSVYDNASGDETPAVVAEIAKTDPRVRYFCQPQHVGIARNFDDGMLHVETPYFSFLADDDLLLPNFYETAIAELEHQPSVMLFAARSISANFDGSIAGTTLNNWPPGIYQPPAGLYAMILHKAPNWTSVVFRREFLSDVGSFDHEIGSHADEDLMLRIAAKHSFVISEKLGGIFFMNPESAAWGTSLADYCNQRSRTIQNMNKFPDGYRAEALRLFESNNGPRLFSHALGSVIRGNRKEAMEAIEMLKSCAGFGKIATIRFLLMLDRMGLKPMVQNTASITRFLRKQRSLSALKDKRKYQEMIDQVLQEVSV